MTVDIELKIIELLEKDKLKKWKKIEALAFTKEKRWDGCFITVRNVPISKMPEQKQDRMCRVKYAVRP